MQNIKKRFVPQIAQSFENTHNENFQELLDKINVGHVRKGVVKGQVVDIKEKVIIIDVGLKNEGMVPIEQFIVNKDQALPQIGDLIEVHIEEGKNGIILSREKAIREDSWKKLKIAYDKGEYSEGYIFDYTKGGYIVNLSGVTAFLPGSQVDLRPSRDITALKGVKQLFEILKMDEKLDNILVSRKTIVEKSLAGARNEMLSKIQKGMTLQGVVKNITNYGAFVDLGGIDGLLHITDIAWHRLNHPSEMLSIGQKVNVMVTNFNEETKRISLGMKQLENNPWQGIEANFPAGQVMTGKVTNIADYGVFIELRDGIEGFVHTSELNWVKSNQNPKKLLTVGQEVKFVILEVDTEKHRISLSIKQCQENPLIKFAEHHPVGTIIKAPVRNITDFGLFVGLEGNIDGLIHESDISWEGNGSELLKNYKKGEEIECKVISVDIEKERIALGIKQLTENSNNTTSDEFKKNMVVTCNITEVREDGIEVNVDDKAQGFIKKLDLSSERADQKLERFAIGDKVDAKIISIDKHTKKLNLSIKAHEIDEREKAIKEYGSIDSGASLGDILGAALGQQNDKSFKGK